MTDLGRGAIVVSSHPIPGLENETTQAKGTQSDDGQDLKLLFFLSGTTANQEDGEDDEGDFDIAGEGDGLRHDGIHLG